MRRVWFGKPLISLNYKQQEYEANFRFGLARLREYGESIAAYCGEAKEQKDAAARFRSIWENFRRLMTKQRQLSWVTSLHWRISFLFPYLVGVPKIFSGEMQFGGLMQTAVAFQQVENALAYLVLHYYSPTEASFAQLQAVVHRLTDFPPAYGRHAGNAAKVASAPQRAFGACIGGACTYRAQTGR